MATFKTTAAYISGAICGDLWMPQTLAGIPYQANLRGTFGIMDKGDTFREVLNSALMRSGGDFQNPQFSADTVIRIERTTATTGGKYQVHVKEIPIVRLAADLVNPDAYTGDFMGDCE